MQEKVTEASYFLNLTIENVRCFGKAQKINLCDEKGIPRQWTIILGDNGVGKTTLLKAFAVGYYWPKASIGNENNPMLQIGWLVEALQPRYGTNRAGIDWEIGQCKTEVGHGSDEIDWQTSWIHARVLEPTKTTPNYLLSESTSGNPSVNSGVNLPRAKVLAYGAARKMGNNGVVDEKDDFASLQLFDEQKSLSNVEEWLAVHEFKALQDGQPNPRLEKIKALLCELLEVNEIKLIGNYKNSSKLAVVVVNDFGEISIRDLSLGYRTLMAWTVDVARWLFDWYPESEHPFAEPAVVLVDEIDLHLHPKFQRRLIEFLSERFPRVQFIVTAHSPLMVQSFAAANVVLLKKEGDQVLIEQKQETYEGWRLDQLLTSDLYGKSSPLGNYARRRLSRRRNLIQKSHRTELEDRELARLNEEVDSWPTADNEEDRRAMELIRIAAKALKTNKPI